MKKQQTHLKLFMLLVSFMLLSAQLMAQNACSVNYQNALKFNGTGGSHGGPAVVCGNNASTNISSNLTIEAWVNYSGNASSCNVIAGRTGAGSGDPGYALIINTFNTSDRKIVFESTTPNPLSTNTSISLNTWHHTAATYDGSTMIIYINGTQVTTKAQTGTITTNTNILAIGQQTGYGEYFGGRVGGVKVYNRSLAATEISHNYNTQKSRFGL
jgi:hypothetical protein